MQPNPNPNNKAAQNIEAPTTFQSYYITRVRCNEIHLQSRNVINPKYSPIITEEECESPKEDTIDIEIVATPVTTNSKRIDVPVTTNSSKVDTPVNIDSTMIAKDPPYPQRLAEVGTTSQLEYDFHRELKNSHTDSPIAGY